MKFNIISLILEEIEKTSFSTHRSLAEKLHLSELVVLHILNQLDSEGRIIPHLAVNAWGCLTLCYSSNPNPSPNRIHQTD